MTTEYLSRLDALRRLLALAKEEEVKKETKPLTRWWRPSFFTVRATAVTGQGLVRDQESESERER